MCLHNAGEVSTTRLDIVFGSGDVVIRKTVQDMPSFRWINITTPGYPLSNQSWNDQLVSEDMLTTVTTDAIPNDILPRRVPGLGRGLAIARGARGWRTCGRKTAQGGQQSLTEAICSSPKRVWKRNFMSLGLLNESRTLPCRLSHSSIPKPERPSWLHSFDGPRQGAAETSTAVWEGQCFYSASGCLRIAGMIQGVRKGFVYVPRVHLGPA